MPARVLEWLADHAPMVLAFGITMGFLAQPLAHLMRPMLIVGIALPFAIALIRLDWRQLATYARRPWLAAGLTAWLLIASPILVWLALAPLDVPEGLRTGLILMAAAPPIMSSAAFALLFGLNAPLVVIMLVGSSALVPFTLPPMALWLLGLDIDIGTFALMARLGAFVGGAFLVAGLVRRFARPAWLQQQARRLDGMGVLSMLIFALAIMDGVLPFAMERPGFVILCVAAAFVSNFALQAITAASWWPIGRSSALAAGLTAGNCNMGLVLAVLADRADFDVVVFFAMAQFPMYMTPLFLMPLYRRLMAGGVK
jgi:BASS family bile acid:Na+ symporter